MIPIAQLDAISGKDAAADFITPVADRKVIDFDRAGRLKREAWGNVRVGGKRRKEACRSSRYPAALG